MVANKIRSSITQYCLSIGGDSLLVQGAGGNISWKDRGTLWIKASGMWMADVKRKNIFVPVDLLALNSAIKNGNFDVTPKLQIGTNLRPSIETLLHALMPHKVVVHLHAVEILSHLVKRDWQRQIEMRIPNFVGWVLVDYCKPGSDLARMVYAVTQGDTKINIVFLRNHGVVIGGASIDEVDDVLGLLTSSFQSPPLTSPNFSASLLDLKTPELFPNYSLVPDLEVQQLALNPNVFKFISSNWALFPDHVVFLGPKPNIFETSDDFIKEMALVRKLPELIFIRGVGVYALSGFNLAKITQLRCYWDVISRQLMGEDLNVLSNRDIADLMNWDAEQYRINMAQ
ncbi:class II aldolase [Polynucleobacter paneuropaeus]|nr:class II aldolase [Polynucleobacter paneuropaeus]